MPHEIFLAALVVALWIFILRHFFTIYSRVTFVSPLTQVAIETAPTKLSVTSRPSFASVRSEASNVSRQRSTSAALDQSYQNVLLEDAVHTWKSETHLTKGELLARSDMLKTPRLTIKTPYKKRSVLSIPDERQLMQLNLTSTKKRSLTFGVKQNCVHMKDLNQKRMSIDKIPDIQVSTTTECDISYSQSAEESHIPKSANPGRRKRALTAGRVVNYDANGQRRKVSEVLLGKATKDIRRQSAAPTLTQSRTMYRFGRRASQALSIKRHKITSALKLRGLRSSSLKYAEESPKHQMSLDSNKETQNPSEEAIHNRMAIVPKSTPIPNGRAAKRLSVIGERTSFEKMNTARLLFKPKQNSLDSNESNDSYDTCNESETYFEAVQLTL
ncbi:hypothetical protein AB6A40_006122 [Gnathostoma spinigerum]|uniref:ATP synthase F0 subunit 8 n=1 Tax=Gnathostoma spinigerum TaxID=75299 RepID=A0ABD6EHM6_9BILA